MSEENKPAASTGMVGDRCYLPTQPHGFHVASLSMNGLVAQLNHADGVTGRVLQQAHIYGMVLFRPDGWPLPRGVHPEGFAVDPDNLYPLAEEEDPLPVKLMTPWHTHVDDADARRMVREYLEHAPPWVFVGTTRDAALGSLNTSIRTKHHWIGLQEEGPE